MAFDLSSITGSVNKYLNSISDTNKLLAQKESEKTLDKNLEGLFEKYLNKAISDETGKKTEESASNDVFNTLMSDTDSFGVNPYIYSKDEVSLGQRSTEISEEFSEKNIDMNIPFPKFDIGSMIADNMASHSRFNNDTFSGNDYQSHHKISVKGIDPFYSNMVRSSVFGTENDMDNIKL